MSFPSTDAAPRTDHNFRNPNRRINAERLHIKEYSILQALPIDIKSFVVADPLHLLELGNMKKYDGFFCIKELRLFVFKNIFVPHFSFSKQSKMNLT